MKTITTTTFVMAFSELNAEQKTAAIELVRDRERSCEDNFFAEGVIEYYKETVLPEYGIDEAELQYSGFWSQGDGASISTDHVDAVKFLRKVRALTKYRSIRHLLNEDDLAMSVERSHSRYAHENTVSGYIESAYTDLTAKQETLVNELEELLTDTIRELSRKLYRDLENAYEDQFTTENITALIEGNEYQFNVIDGVVESIEY
ncbi:TPA: hypothetical protein J7738_000354 [Escherichia coli]|nr:hypothetical protein [Escherichia coli]